MNRFQIIVPTIVLGLSLSSVGFSQSIKASGVSVGGSNTNSSVGTITGSKVGTITGSKAGNIGGMRAGKISEPPVSGIDVDNYFSKLLMLMLRSGTGF